MHRFKMILLILLMIFPRTILVNTPPAPQAISSGYHTAPATQLSIDEELLDDHVMNGDSVFGTSNSVINSDSVRSFRFQTKQIPFKRGVNLADWLENFLAVSHIHFLKYTRQNFADIRSLGCDHIRLPLELLEMVGPAPEYTLDPLPLGFLDQAIDWAEEMGLYLILDNHSFEIDIDTSPAILDPLKAVWAQLAERYTHRSRLLHYEILNEPHGISDSLWNLMQQQVIDTIRTIDQTHTIIVQPANWDSFLNLQFMPCYEDTNLIYTFHFYDPGIFTGQGNMWSNPDLQNLAGIPYPYDEDEMPALPSEFFGTWVEIAYNIYPFEANDAWVQSRLDIAVKFMNERQVPLWCGEFGVYRTNCDLDDRTHWLNTVRTYLETNNIGWTMWEYAGGYGIFENSRELFDYDVNIPVINALGLNPPPQREFQLLADTTGFIIYDDLIPQRVFHQDWNPNGQLNFCSTVNPVAGDFCISWSDADRYSFIGFRFSPMHDLTRLKSDNYLLDFWVSCANDQAKFDVRLVDTDTDDPDDHPWRMRYVIDNTLVDLDGTWQHVQIPLQDMVEHGAWENNTWYNPRGEFDWSEIQCLEIASEYHDLKNLEIVFDEIKIIEPHHTITMFQNPIIPGFYPDPSICRVEDDYYLVTSSFEYFPGVPIFHSRDLVHWHQIGYCLTRKSQLNLDHAAISGGVYAPTIRYHDGVFYMVTSNFNYGGNFFVTATDPAGPWSEPHWLNDWEMDASLLFDDDGTVYYTRHGGGEHGYAGQFILNTHTGKLEGALKILWSGTGGVWPEGPHLYKINDKYYLMIAEGGTSYDHMETIARSDTPWGPFIANPDNPILTHRDRIGHPIQATGHADLVETSDGWWLVCLGIRPKGGNFHHLGRETFLAPVEWNDEGWPVVNNNGTIESTMQAPNLPQYEWAPEPERDDFNSNDLRLPWNFVRNPYDEDWSLSDRPGFLRLNGSAVSLNDQDSPAFVGRRQTAFNCLAATRLEFAPVAEDEEAGLIVRGNDLNHYEIGLTLHSGNRVAFFRKVLHGQTSDIVYQQIPDGSVILKLYATDFDYSFYYQLIGEPEQMLGHGLTKDLSTETIGGFTGVYIGMFATGNGRRNTHPADFDWFEYSVDPVLNPQQMPYLGSGVRLPGRVEAEDYDMGASGIAYWDSDEGNSGGQYRSDDVDIEITNDTDGGCNVGWITDKEWLEYTVHPDQGFMDLEVRVASIYAGGQITLTLDGVTLGHITVPVTGGWQSWQTLCLPGVSIQGGENKILRLHMIGSGFNINWIQFTKSNTAVPSTNLIPMHYVLEQNYPNPFNLMTRIRYSIPHRSLVHLEIVNVLGQKICTLVDAIQEPGAYTVDWDTMSYGLDDTSSGIYFCCIEAISATQIFHARRKLMLLK